jgi:Tol biopolymer transport system component
VFWTDLNAGTVWLNQSGGATEVSASQCSLPSCKLPAGRDGTGVYWTASTDGQEAFFTSPDRLTNDSKASATAIYGDLYEYDVAAGQLTDLTLTQGQPLGADVQGVVGASDDGSYVYFVANGSFAGAAPGQCGGNKSTPQSPCNLYLWHDGTITFVAQVEQGDSQDWTLLMPQQRSFRAQVSPDGTKLLFTSAAAPTSGYDNAGHSEVYLYNAASATTTCVSCNPSGPANGDAVLAAPAALPGVEDFEAPLAVANNMSPDGSRVFFESSDALTPQDTNGLENVYEWEAPGSGSCPGSSGCVFSISSGRSDASSYFETATPSGNDAFFLTREDLVPQGTESTLALYDARVGGGFAPPASQPSGCSGEDCRGAPTSAPATPVAASVTFSLQATAGAATGPGQAPKSSVRMLQRVVRGPSFRLRVQAPRAGSLLVSNRMLRTLRRRLPRAGKYVLRLTLTPRAGRELRQRHRLPLTLRVEYTPAGGRASSATVKITVVAT